MALDPAALATIALKSGAYLLTGSVGLLSDAVQATVNLVAAVMALAMLTIAARPADSTHAYGHGKAGARRFVSLHVVVPGQWTVHQGHKLLERIEEGIRRELPGTTVFTHLESLDDPASWDDVTLDRAPRPVKPPGDPPGES